MAITEQNLIELFEKIVSDNSNNIKYVDFLGKILDYFSEHPEYHQFCREFDVPTPVSQVIFNLIKKSKKIELIGNSLWNKQKID